MSDTFTPPDTEVARREKQALGLPTETIPRHIALIMDGNGRWAKRQGLDRSIGHKAGAEAVIPIVKACANLGVEALTLYTFSTENWTRPGPEIQFLMELCPAYLKRERQLLIDNNLRFRHLGRRAGLPDVVLHEIDTTLEVTKHHTGMTMSLAMNYGSRGEIIDGVRDIARRAAAGEITPDDIDQRTIDESLDTAGLPDPDLLIRTAGQMRLSNYLLWQISYAELWVTDVYWPEFTVEHLRKALRDFAGRTRRYGAVEDKEQES